MCALNCPAWHLQDSSVVPVVAADDEYTAMIHGLGVYLSECFHEETNDFQAPDLKLVDCKMRLWMLNKADLPELEEQSLDQVTGKSRLKMELVDHRIDHILRPGYYIEPRLKIDSLFWPLVFCHSSHRDNGQMSSNLLADSTMDTSSTPNISSSSSSSSSNTVNHQ
eukprot:scaffold141521_cov66-Attheya_sp.AAC.1